MNNPINIGFVATVKIVSNELTNKLNIAEKQAKVYGETTPSVAEVIRENKND